MKSKAAAALQRERTTGTRSESGSMMFKHLIFTIDFCGMIFVATIAADVVTIMENAPTNAKPIETKRTKATVLCNGRVGNVVPTFSRHTKDTTTAKLTATVRKSDETTVFPSAIDMVDSCEPRQKNPKHYTGKNRDHINTRYCCSRCPNCCFAWHAQFAPHYDKFGCFRSDKLGCSRYFVKL